MCEQRERRRRQRSSSRSRRGARAVAQADVSVVPGAGAVPGMQHGGDGGRAHAEEDEREAGRGLPPPTGRDLRFVLYVYFGRFQPDFDGREFKRTRARSVTFENTLDRPRLDARLDHSQKPTELQIAILSAGAGQGEHEGARFFPKRSASEPPRLFVFF